MFRKLLLLWVLAVFFLHASAQTAQHSVLASGSWYKLSISAPGVYRMDLKFLNSLGLPASIPSSQLRLFGNGGHMLSESNASPRPDDLVENSIAVFDGGDGQINGDDYVLFYASGPHPWIADSTRKRFVHSLNIYSDSSFYFLTVGGQGLRINTQSPQGSAGVTVTSFDEHFFHELDTVNLLASGKEWLGEELSSNPGRTLTRSFPLPFSDVLPQPAVITTAVAARSAGSLSHFNISWNGQPIQDIPVDPVGTGIYDLYAKTASQSSSFVPPAGSGQLNITYSQGGFNSQGWINWLELQVRRPLTLPTKGQLLFRDWNSVGQPAAGFSVTNGDAQTQIWEVSDPLHPLGMRVTTSANTSSFVNDASHLREYVAFSQDFLVPVGLGKVPNQDLHASPLPELVIVTYPDFMNAARQIEAFHKPNMAVQLVSTQEIYNEFSSGSPDVTAIRDFMRFLYLKYASSWKDKGRYLLLLGRGSYDYKHRVPGNTNFVPAWETTESFDPLSTYTSDDFFGFLDDNEDVNQTLVRSLLDVGVGRIPARTNEEATNFVEKLLAYHAPAAFGPWRNEFNLIADDEDQNLHLDDAETMSATVKTTDPVFNQQKIYLDAFQQEGGSAGGRYPQANSVINNNILNGTLIWNYTGHGSASRLAEEVIVDQTIINSWKNPDRLPLFITATCDFVPYDNPVQRSLGEQLLLRKSTGAIALMSTTRVVFAFSNRIINNNYLRLALQTDTAGKHRSLGQAVMDAKNDTYSNSTDVINNRKFTLIGDPAMTLAFPLNKVRIDQLNGIDPAFAPDTLKAMQPVLVQGTVLDPKGQPLTNFQGTAYLSVFDKEQRIQTLGNDPASIPTTFPDQENILFKGRATVTNGKFEFQFKMPRDINYQFGPGKFSLYAQDGKTDAAGYSNAPLIGGLTDGVDPDKQGPVISAWLNDESFVNGSITNSTPILILKLADSSGINTASSGVGHDLVATLDNDNNKYYILNNLYETDQDDYKHGSLRFQLAALDGGPHSLRIKAWDALNNSSEYVLDFNVVNQDKLRLDHVLNYPNPFTTHTSFWFEHNFPGVDLAVRVEIFTVAGRIIKTLSRTINSEGTRSSEVEWDSRDEYGNRIGRGVYLYRLRVRGPGGKSAEKWEKLVIL